jgi:hypothetical protein
MNILKGEQNEHPAGVRQPNLQTASERQGVVCASHINEVCGSSTPAGCGSKRLMNTAALWGRFNLNRTPTTNPRRRARLRFADL